MPSEDAVDPEQAAPGGEGVEDEQNHAGGVVEAGSATIEGVSGDDFEAEEGPFRSPDPVELVDHESDGARADSDPRS